MARNPSGSKKKWLDAHAQHSGDECLIFPFPRLRNGYGHFGKPHIAAHRYMCGLLNGEPPTDKHQAAHSCGRGADGCVNPTHLSWKTNAENQVERYQHSGPTRGTKITPAQVDEIRLFKGSAAEAAGLYGISETHARDIQSVRARSSAKPRRVFEDHEVLLIRETAKSASKLAKEFGYDRNVIERIRRRETYKTVTEQL